MASSIYSEVTSVSTRGYERDRVLDKLNIAREDLPYNLDDILISHNDFAVADVYNDSIKKIYSNYLYLIANAEITSNTTSITAIDKYITFNSSYSVLLSSITEPPSGSEQISTLSGLGETFITKKKDSNKFLIFNYSKEDSIVSESNTSFSSVLALLAGNEVEFNKTFKFKNVVSVDVVDNFLFVLDKDANTCFKFDITGLITEDIGLKRTGVLDKEHPGRYLLKTIGGEGISQVKNKLNSPNSISIYNNLIYILDTGHNSIKVFDLDFNFVKEVNAPNLFNNPNYGELVSLVVDAYSDTNDTARGYILSSKGKIFEYLPIINKINVPTDLYDFYDTRLQVLSGVSFSDTFNKIVNSKIRKNIIYVNNKGRIYKYYKSNFKTYITEFDLESKASGLQIGNETNQQEILSFDTVEYNNQEYIIVTTINNPNKQVSNYIFIDKHDSVKLYNEDFYSNYFSLSSIIVLPQEVVNNITFNKTTKKLIYNHYSFFENLNKKIYSYYAVRNSAMYPTLCAVMPYEYSVPTALNENSNMYIGVNEPLLTDVVNRPLKLLFEQQVAIFDLLKEEKINNNPPDDFIIHLPGSVEDFPNVISIESINPVSAGEFIQVNVTRTNVLSTKPSCSFRYWTTGSGSTETDSLSDIISYIDVNNKNTGKFAKNVNTFTIEIPTKQFFGHTLKQFSINIEAFTNCIVDPESSSSTITITPIGDIYTVSLDSATGTVNEGGTKQILVKRERVDGISEIPTENVSSSINVRIGTYISSTEYTPVIAGANVYSYTEGKYADFPRTSVSQQTSAINIDKTSTITFNDQVTSVVFDISAKDNLTDDPGRVLDIFISNPSQGTSIPDSSIKRQTITFDHEYKTVNLFLSAISGSYVADGSTALVSCVNIWSALSADTTYQEFSGTNPFNVYFTVNSPLSVFSVSTLSAAIQFDPTVDLIYGSNNLYIDVEDGAGIIGKAGAGGHGYLWLSGQDFLDDSSVVYLSASEFTGEDGGPAIGNINMATYFSTISTNNNGKIYGGAGGGGGGVLGVSASNMPNVSSLSAGCGGGGGQGIHNDNTGAAGLGAVEEQLSDADEDGNEDEVLVQHPGRGDIFIQDGSAGTTSSGGAGGHFNTGAGGYPSVSLDSSAGGGTSVAITQYMMMSGLSGGALGAPGQSDETFQFAFAGEGGTNFDSISGEWAIRDGGDVGSLYHEDITDTDTQVLTSASGEFKVDITSNLDIADITD